MVAMMRAGLVANMRFKQVPVSDQAGLLWHVWMKVWQQIVVAAS